MDRAAFSRNEKHVFQISNDFKNKEISRISEPEEKRSHHHGRLWLDGSAAKMPR
jgi:hypothetical protein